MVEQFIKKFFHLIQNINHSNEFSRENIKAEWYSSTSPHDVLIMSIKFNGDEINKEGATKKLATRIKTFECENTRSGIKFGRH